MQAVGPSRHVLAINFNHTRLTAFALCTFFTTTTTTSSYPTYHIIRTHLPIYEVHNGTGEPSP